MLHKGPPAPPSRAPSRRVPWKVTMEALGGTDASARDEELGIGTTSAQAHLKVCLPYWVNNGGVRVEAGVS